MMPGRLKCHRFTSTTLIDDAHWARTHMRTAALLALLVCAAALAVPQPVAAADPWPELGILNPEAPANVTLYFHMNGFQEFPINTQKPVDWFKPAPGVGLATHSGSCGGLASGTPADKEYHTWRGFSSPGYVEYEYTPNGQPIVHAERGLSYDIEFGGDTLLLHWYLATQTALPSSQQADPDVAPVVLPNVVVRGTLRAGEEVAIDGSGYDSGALVAQGQSAPATLAMQATTGATWTQVDGQNVYEFVVPLELKARTIPKDQGFNLRVDAFLDNPQCTDPASTGYLMPNLVKVHTSPDLRPRMDVQVGKAVKIEYLHPQFLLGKVVFHASANSPWGNYDVDETPGGITLEVLGPDGTPAAPSLRPSGIVQRTHDHDHHTEAVDIAYTWPYQEDDAPDGVYTVRFSVRNDQATATAYATGRFELGDVLKVSRCGSLEGNGTACVDEVQNEDGSPGSEPVAKSPGAAGGAIVAVLAVAAFSSRRRR